jgi:hypothetical protein
MALSGKYPATFIANLLSNVIKFLQSFTEHLGKTLLENENGSTT